MPFEPDFMLKPEQFRKERGSPDPADRLAETPGQLRKHGTEAKNLAKDAQHIVS